MKKYGWYFIAFILLSFSLVAQELPYALQQAQLPIRSISGTFPAYNINETLVDIDGSTYITGYFRGSSDFDPGVGTVTLTSQVAGVYDAFLAKYNAQGNLIYAKAINGAADKRGNSISLLNNGKILVAGYFFGSANFDPGISDFTLTSAGGSDAFYARFSATGDFEFAAQLGGLGNDGVGKLEVGPANEGYAYGWFAQTVDFDVTLGVDERTAESTQDRFLVKYDANLALQWVNTFSTLFITTIGLDASGFYAAGNFSLSSDMDPGPATLPKVPAGSSDIWLSKFDLSGNLMWSNVIGGTDFENVFDLAIDATSNIYLSGIFYGTADFDPSAGNSPLTSLGSGDAYVAKYAPTGALVWAKNWGGAGVDEARSLVLLQGNTLVTVGNFVSTSMDADPGVGTKLLVKNGGGNDGSSDAYLSLLTSDGNFIDAFSYGLDNTVSPVSESAGIVNGNTTTFSILGNFTQSVDFDPSQDSTSIANPNGQQQAYLNRYILLAPLPAAQPTALVLSNQTGSSIDVSFTGSGADGYAVIRRAGSAAVSQPKDGRAYFVGEFLNDGVVVYAGPATSFIDANLAANTTYHYQVYAYSNTSGGTNYLTSSPLAGSAATTAITYSRTTDSLALVTLYNSTNGPGWTNSANWLTGSIDTWNGVTVVGNRVTEIDLAGYSLTGFIPSAVGNLTALTQLYLMSNNLSGNIPMEITTLSSLLDLRLSTNQLTGSIPPEIPNLSSLTHLELGSNQLTGSIPASMGTMTNLQSLYLPYNKLSGTIPTSLGNLTAALTLVLDGNQLSGQIPTELGNLSALSTLSLAGNQLSGSIPIEIGNLPALTALYLNSNQLTGSIPAELGGLTSLTSLTLFNNQLSGVIPTELGNLSTLASIDLASNMLTGSIPPSIFSIPTLQTFGARNNQLSGSIPNELTNATNLINLWIDVNQFSGTLPAVTSTSNPNIDQLAVNGNRLDALPDLTSLNGQLSYLNIANNNLTFEDIEPNIGISGMVYSPQNLIGLADTLTVSAGAPLNLSFTVGGTANIYQWKKNVSTNVGVNADSFSIPAVSITDAGTYILTTTNSLVSGLTLTSANQVVIVKAEGAFEWVTNAGDLTAEGLVTPGTSLTDQNYGGSWGDFNNDGFEDLFVGGIATQERSYLYKNNGNGTFSKLPNNAYAYSAGRSMTWADYNNDGWLDAFAPAGVFGPDSATASFILKNNGNETFAKINLPGNPASTAGTWADTDNDGDVDLILNGGSGFPTLHRNDGSDTFVALSPFTTNPNSQWNIIAIDVNSDARMDIYIPDDTQRNFYEGEGNNTFYLNTFSPLTTDLLNGARGVSWADIDNDGDFDAYLMGNSVGNLFYKNDGYGNFTQETSLTILGETIFGGRGSAFADYDNDGYVDLLSVQNQAPAGWYLFRNNGNGTFTKQLTQSFKAGPGFIGASFADYNNDGFVDIFSASFGQDYNALYRNVGNANKYLKIKLVGTASNRNGIGAVVSVKAEGFWRYHQVITANGFANQNSLTSHFGLGSAAIVDSVVVHWPSGSRQILLNQTSDQLLTITEPANTPNNSDLELIASYQVKSQNISDFVSPDQIVIDPNDNIIMTGYFEGTVDFDPSAGETLVSDNSQYEENYIAKYTSAGALAWVYTLPYGNDYTDNHEIETIITDATGNILTGGELRGTADVDPGSGVIELTSSNADGEPVFTKLDANGNLLWAKQLPFTPSSFGNADSDVIAVDASGSIILSGRFYNGTLDVDPSGATTTLSTADDNGDLFLAKYDANGNYLWAVRIGEDLIYEYASGLVTDSQNNIYLTYDLDTNGGNDDFTRISKYSSSGSLLWTTENENTYIEGSIGSIKIDEANNKLYITGGYKRTPIFNGTSGSGTLPFQQANTDGGFVASYDLNGAFLNVFGLQSSNEAYPISINLLNDGNLIISGGYGGTIDLDPSSNSFEQFYPEAAFIVKLTPTGDFLWGASLPRSEGIVTQLNSQNQLVGALYMNSQSVVDIDPSSDVTNLNTLGDDFAFVIYDIQGGGISAADSLALQAFYNATGGPNWTTRTNWLSGNISTWFGVTVAGNEITAISLPNNNLIGTVPPDALTLDKLTTLNVSGNSITSIPDLSTLPLLTALNISNNKLDFASLEYNMDVAGIDYSNQKPIVIAADSILVASGEDYTLTTSIGGTANQYQWRRNGNSLANSTDSDIFVEAIGRQNMGGYSVEVTSSLVPTLTLTTVPVNILATATLSGKLLMPAAPASAGIVRLLRVTASNGYDTIKTQAINTDGTYSFNQIVLDDYQIVGFADTLVTNQKLALPTYYPSTLYWEEADTLFVENSLTDLDIVSQLEPTEPLVADGAIVGIVQEDDGTGSRTEKNSRVGGAGVSARRAQGTGRGKEILELVAYVFTDENGAFSISGLPPNDYRINIQYPGYPMDETSFIDIPIGSTPLDETVNVEATVADGKISVRQLVITSIEGDNYKAEAYPNPASGAITISFEDTAPQRSVSLMDARGKNVVTKSAPGLSVKMEMGLLEPGFYLVKVTDAGNEVKIIRITIL